MVRLSYAALIVCILAAAGCGDPEGPSSSPPPSGGGNTISGRERFGWVQTVASEGDLALYRYALYVDGARRVVEGESCAATAAPTSFECSAPLPPLTPGAHTLELAAFVTSGDTVLESPRSAPLQVSVAGATAPADGANAAADGPLVSSDGLRFHAAVIARGVIDPVDIAVAPERVLIAERGGTVHVLDASGRVIRDAENVVRMLEPAGDAELLSIAAARDFEESGVVWLAYGSPDRDGRAIRIARLRERAGQLGEQAVLASFAVPAGASAIVRAGPDGALYVGIGSGAEPDSAQNLSRAAGKILRLSTQGRTADDNPWRSPVFSIGHRAPSGLDWHPSGDTLLEVEPHDAGDEINLIQRAGNYGWPLSGRRPSAQAIPPMLRLPAGAGAAGAVVIRAEDSPLYGDLIVSAPGLPDLLRVRFDEEGRARLAARILQGRFGRTGRIAADPSGALYILTANGGNANGPGELLLRLAPEAAQ